MNADYLSLREVADHLGVHYMTVYRYVRIGILPAHKEGREWRIALADLDAFRRQPAAPATTAAPWADRLLQRLLAFDQAGSWSVIESALVSGVEVSEVYTTMIIPSMKEIGSQWEVGVINVADEHAATAIAARLVSRLGPRMTRRGVRKGTVVFGTTASELHALPLSIAADIFRASGYDVLDLGSNLPPDSFAHIAASAPRLLAVGVSATTSGQEEAIHQTVRALREVVDVPLILGGRSTSAAQNVGADGAAMNALEGVQLLEELLKAQEGSAAEAEEAE